MVILTPLSLIAPVASTTLIVKLLVPGVVGIPLIFPVTLSSDNPAGNKPLTTDQLNGAVPPPILNDELYSIPGVPGEKEAFNVVNGLFIVRSPIYAETASPLLSVTLT